ncbi:Concanavalin A-like lectin/glucanase superfamily [Artemisia annua]|uniref:Concanavalin A-like lectin/glucanase superfamily n=1 Tax=Artemisia annua TaxID=35608 RepID=A0A2U1PSY3_ARTAN|nr:Concanavalin A-like lectin/glucanase superfamily [Artemisia annua]
MSRSFISLVFLSFFFKTLFADSFNLAQNPSLITLYGDAKLIKNTTSLELSSLRKSVGSVIYKKPIKIYGGTPKKLVSFSTYFSFNVSYGNTLAFGMFPVGYPLNGSFGLLGSKKFRSLSVEFEDHLGFMSAKVMNMSSVDLVVNASVKMQTWINYEAGSKRLEVRVNMFGENRPVDPVVFVQLDLLKIWPKSKKVFVGLSSINRNSSQGCEVDSWTFKASIAPDWMHSQPLDPMVLNQGHEVKVVVPKESDCVVKILVALMVGIGCGALGTIVGMFMCTVLSNRKRRPIVPEEFAVKSLQEYEHKKLKIVLDEASANEK